MENKQPAFNRAAGQPELVGSFEGVVESWCSRRAVVSLPIVSIPIVSLPIVSIPMVQASLLRLLVMPWLGSWPG